MGIYDLKISIYIMKI
ncbi:hypothetical protein YPPY60_2099, partial [Yersinia pestis PY-60]